MSGSTQESVIIDIWTVPPGRQEEMINELRAAFERFRLIDGFIEGGVLANGDDTKMASYVRVRSSADRERGAEYGRRSGGCRGCEQGSCVLHGILRACGVTR